jgi:4-hydroxy-2-oxoheptanedioate aldolase
MRENRLRKIWAAGGAAVNGWLAIPHAFSAETMAHQGWDSLTIDIQHGVVDYQAAVYIGPSDLSLALGCKPTFDKVEKPAAEAIDYILAKAKEHGAVAGIHNGTPEFALARAGNTIIWPALADGNQGPGSMRAPALDFGG